MSGWIRQRLRAAMAAAATLTGKRFGLLVASSVVATSAIVAAAATNQPEASPLASILGHSLAADRTPVKVVEPAAEPEPEEVAEAVGNESTPAPEPSITPTPEPESTFIPEETAPEPTSEPEPEPEEEPAEETETAPPPPEAGQIKHVFVVSLVSSGYQTAFGKASAMPYLSGTLVPRARCSAITKCLTRRRRRTGSPRSAASHRTRRRRKAARSSKRSPRPRPRPRPGSSPTKAAPIRSKSRTLPLNSKRSRSPGTPTWKAWSARPPANRKTASTRRPNRKFR